MGFTNPFRNPKRFPWKWITGSSVNWSINYFFGILKKDYVIFFLLIISNYLLIINIGLYSYSFFLRQFDSFNGYRDSYWIESEILGIRIVRVRIALRFFQIDDWNQHKLNRWSKEIELVHYVNTLHICNWYLWRYML